MARSRFVNTESVAVPEAGAVINISLYPQSFKLDPSITSLMKKYNVEFGEILPFSHKRIVF